MAGRLPALGEDDFESQMPFPPLIEREDNYFHEAMEHRSMDHTFDRPGGSDNVDTVDKVDNAEMATNAQDSNPSIVEETQTVPLEIETQPESFQSLIEETQYMPLEEDTQAETQAIDPSATRIAIPALDKAIYETRNDAHQDEISLIDFNDNAESYPMPAGRVQSGLPATGFIKLPKIIERPIIDNAADAAKGFKFSAAKPTVVRVQSKIPTKSFEATIGEATGSRSATELEDQVESVVPQTQAISDIPLPKIKSRTISIHSWPQNASTSVPHEATKTPSSKPETENGTVQSLPQGLPTPRHRAISHVRAIDNTQRGKAQDVTPAPNESSHGHALRDSKPPSLNQNGGPITSVARNHNEASQDTPPRQDEYVIQRSQVGRPDHVEKDRRESDQQSYQLGLLAPLSAAQSGGSVQRKVTTARIKTMPFPDAVSERPARPRNRPTNDQLKTNASEAMCNEKRTRTHRSDSARLLGEPKENYVAAAGLPNSADTRSVAAQYHEPSATSAVDLGLTHVVHTSMLEIQPSNTAKHPNIDVEDQSVFHRLQAVQDLSTVNNRSHASLPSNSTELLSQMDRDADHAAQSHSRRGRKLHENTSRGLDRAIWPPVFAGIPQDEHCDPRVSNHTQDVSRTVSPAESETRRDSRRSNRGQPMTRPVRTDDLISRPSSARSSRVVGSKVTKQAGQQIGMNSTATVTAPTGNRTRVLPTRLMEMLHEFEEVYHTLQEREDIIEKQNLEIDNLEKLNAVSQLQTETLEAEKNHLTLKINKYAELSSKYKKHMNEVVNSQKFLRDQATQMKARAEEVLKTQKLEQKQHVVLKKIEKAVKEARDMRGSVEERQNLLDENEKLIKQNRELSLVQLQKQRLAELNERLNKDNNRFKAALDIERKRIEALQNDYDRKSHELSCEMRNKEQLEKQLETQSTVYQQLVEHLKQLPEAVSEQLQKKDGILSGILSAEEGTQSRIGELVSLVNHLRDIEPKAPAALVQLIEDLSSRLENREQDSDASLASFKEATTKALEEVKETVKQLCLDETTQTQYHDRISRLEKANETLTNEKVTRGHEVQSLTQQLEELRRELTDCQDQLKAREDELAEARAIPKKDPRLNAKLKELEVAKSIMDSQLESANQELLKAKDEVKSVREVVDRKDQQIKGLEQKSSNHEKTIKAFNEVRDKYMAAKENEKHIACQELAKKAEAQKETQRVKLESKVNNALQRYQEKESELVQTKQKIQEIQAQLDAQKDSANNQTSEQATLVPDTKERLARIQHLIEKATGQKNMAEFSQELRSIKLKATESNIRYGSAINQLSKVLSSATEERRRMDGKLGKVIALKTKLQDLKGRCSLYEKQIIELQGVGNQQQQTLIGAVSQRESANVTPNLPSLPAGANSTNSGLPRQVQRMPQNSVNDGPEGVRRWAAQNTSTDHIYGTNSMVTPRKRVSLGLGHSNAAAWNVPQQQVPASQTPENTIKPFSMLTTPSPPFDTEASHMTSTQHDGGHHESATVRSMSRAAGRGSSITQSNPYMESTGGRHNSGTNGGTNTQISQREANRNVTNPSAFSNQVTKHAKPALKHKLNPNLAIETASIEAKGRQDSKPHQAFGWADIHGIRSGNVAELPNVTAQRGNKQPPAVSFQGQSSPLPPPIDRYKNPKRPYDGQAPSGAPKRFKAMRKLSKQK